MIEQKFDSLSEFTPLNKSGHTNDLSGPLLQLEEFCGARLPTSYTAMFTEGGQAFSELRELRITEWNVAQAMAYHLEKVPGGKPYYWSHIHDPEEALSETERMQGSEWGNAFEIWPKNAFVIGTFDGDHPLVMQAGAPQSLDPVIALHHDPGAALYFARSIIDALRKLKDIAGAEFYHAFIGQTRESQRNVCDRLASEISASSIGTAKLEKAFEEHREKTVPDKDEMLNDLVKNILKNATKDRTRN